jgi:hypothetical protein
MKDKRFEHRGYIEEHGETACDSRLEVTLLIALWDIP